jgi:hypothetical protein
VVQGCRAPLQQQGQADVLVCDGSSCCKTTPTQEHKHLTCRASYVTYKQQIAAWGLLTHLPPGPGAGACVSGAASCRYLRGGAGGGAPPGARHAA